MVATNMPTAANEMESPAASATRPACGSVSAAPRTMGSIGKTHGESTESTPAVKARAKEPINNTIGRSQCLIQQSGDRRAVCVANGSAFFLVTLEHDKRGLQPPPEPRH